MRWRLAQRQISKKAQSAKTRITKTAQPRSVDPATEPVAKHRAMKRALNPPDQNEARPNLVLGRSSCRAQRNASNTAQNAKTTVRNVARPLSFDFDGEAVTKRRAIKRRLNPPDHNVARPSLVTGRRIRFTRALKALNLGSLIIRALTGCNYGETTP